MEEEQYIDNRPKVLFAAIYAPTYMPEAMIKGLEDNGYNVIPYDWQKVRFNESELGMQQRLAYKCQMERPEFVLLHMHNEDCLTVEFVQELSLYAPVVIMTFDVRAKEDMLWMYEVSKHVAVSLYASQEDVDACKELGVNSAYVLESSCNMEWYRDLGKERTNDIVFIGNNYVNTNLKFELAQERADMVDFLKSNYPNNFKAYGRGFSEMVNTQQEILIYNTAKIAICHNNFHRELYTSDRLWRAMACGTMVLTKYFKGIEKMLDRGENVDWWHDFNELKEKIDYYLANGTKRLDVAIKGRTGVRWFHTWSDRFRFLKALINKHNNG